MKFQKTKKTPPFKSKQNNISGSFKLIRPSFEGDILIPFKYSDKYFYNTSANFSLQLARISMITAYAAFNSPNIENGCENLESLLKVLGFSNFMSNEDYHKKTGTDTIGVGIASKEINYSSGKYTLIYVGLRGGNYHNEWAGNFHVGEKGNHEGFNISSTEAFIQLQKYINIFNISGRVKIWSSGFSRGAATCNLLGGKIADLIEENNFMPHEIEVSHDDLFFYCFETPQGAQDFGTDSKTNILSHKYVGIHNIINLDDLVPRMGPSAMGFKRYGNDYILPKASDENYDDFLQKTYKYYSSIDDGQILKLIQKYNNKFKYVRMSPFEKNEMEAPEFLDRAMMNMSYIAEYRTGMFKIEEEIMNFLVLINSYDKTTNSVILKHLLSEIVKDADKIAILIFPSEHEKLEKTILNTIDKTFKNLGILSYDHEKALKFANTFGNFYWNFANKYPEDAINLAFNLFSFIAPHDPLLEISMLETLKLPSYEMEI
ncbi:MAG: hypothetical protein PUD72_00390 [Oscillospiraceae bacterium]|nr:hypothetical protein [Oscillospiraceae bacterium]